MQLNSLAKRFARQIGGRKKLCMMPCHSFHVYGTWNSKEVGVGVGLKSSFGGGQDITGEDHFCGGGGGDWIPQVTITNYLVYCYNVCQVAAFHNTFNISKH